MFRLSYLRILTIAGFAGVASISVATTTDGFFEPDSIFKHVSVLAADSLEGRQVGELGEWKASEYIVSLFRQAGLEPHGSKTASNPYLQPFTFAKSYDLGQSNELALNDVPLKPGEDYIPLPQSASIPSSSAGVIIFRR